MLYTPYIYSNSDSDDIIIRKIDATAKANNEIHENCIADLKKCWEIIKTIFGEFSNEYKYIKRLLVPKPPDYPDIIERRENKRRMEEKAAAIELQLREESIKELEYYARCADYCNKHNLTWDIGCAKFTAEVHCWESIMKDIEGKEVNGPCEECGKWIVGERRCVCGNTRNYIDQHDDWSIDNPQRYSIRIG